MASEANNADRPEYRPSDLKAEPVWRHLKRGSVYTVVGIRDGMVLYIAHADGKRWYRPLDEFCDGRFEPLRTESWLTPEEMGFSRG